MDLWFEAFQPGNEETLNHQAPLAQLERHNSNPINSGQKQNTNILGFFLEFLITPKLSKEACQLNEILIYRIYIILSYLNLKWLILFVSESKKVTEIYWAFNTHLFFIYFYSALFVFKRLLIEMLQFFQ